MEAEQAEQRAGAVIDQTRALIDRFGGRAAGSDAENAAQEELLAQLAAIPHAADAHAEPFRVAPHAFMFFEPLLCVFCLLAIACYWLHATGAAWVLAHTAFVVFVLELGLYKEFLDPLFPSRTSHNVMVRIPPLAQQNQQNQKAVRRRVILGGHADSAFEWRLNLHCTVLWTMHFLQFGAALAVLVTTYLGAYRGLPMLYAHCACIACLLTTLAMTNFFHAVPGANDNLSGTYAVLELARHFAQDGHRLRNTELVALITGSEEAGLRGAKAFARAHCAELVGSGVETLFLGLETLAEQDCLAVAHRELNGLLRCDERAVGLVCRASKAALGTELPRQSVYCGATDSAAMAQAGVAAVTVEGMSAGPANYYHTRRDNADNMSRECIRDALLVVSRAVRLFDENGLGSPCVDPALRSKAASAATEVPVPVYPSAVKGTGSVIVSENASSVMEM